MERINAAAEELKNVFYAAYEQVMKNTQAAAGDPTQAGADAGAAAGGAAEGVYDADFKDVDEQ